MSVEQVNLYCLTYSRNVSPFMEPQNLLLRLQEPEVSRHSNKINIHFSN
jgi:hypothetical protein